MKLFGLQLSVIIVNFNVKYFLEQCLLSVQKACVGLTVEIFVVDNYSSDGSQEYLVHKFPGVIFKWNKTNPGFGKANNSVLQEAIGKHILFLNPDTIIPEDCFERCLHFFDTNADCGALGVRMLDGSGKFLKESKRGLPSVRSAFSKMAGLSSVFPRSAFFAAYYAGHLKERESQKVDVLAGAFMMLSKKAIDATGGFDERFFMYAEDIDLSYRIQLAGMENYYFPEISIIHFKGESTQRASPEYVKHFYGAMGLFLKKHYPHKRVMLVLMNAAIGAGKIVARVKQQFIASTNIDRGNYHTAIVAEPSRFTKCIKILQHAQPPVTITGRIAINAGDGAASIGTIHQIADCIKDDNIQQIVFCEGEISYKQIIDLTDAHAGKVNFLFSGNGSNSIVGSSRRNEKGKFIALP